LGEHCGWAPRGHFGYRIATVNYVNEAIGVLVLKGSH